MVVLVVACLVAHHIWSEIGERLDVVLPLGFTWRVPSVLHCCVWSARDGLAQPDFATPRQHVLVATMAEATPDAHVLVLVHHGGVTARDADLLLLDTRLFFGHLCDWTL